MIKSRTKLSVLETQGIPKLKVVPNTKSILRDRKLLTKDIKCLGYELVLILGLTNTIFSNSKGKLVDASEQAVVLEVSVVVQQWWRS